MGRSADDIGTIHEWFNPPTPDWFASCATSGHPLLRRIAATFPHLPANLAERLAQDPDEDVRHLLAYNHPLAPPHLLLDALITARRPRRSRARRSAGAGRPRRRRAWSCPNSWIPSA